jgi:hypothetical protein
VRGAAQQRCGERVSVAILVVGEQAGRGDGEDGVLAGGVGVVGRLRCGIDVRELGNDRIRRCVFVRLRRAVGELRTGQRPGGVEHDAQRIKRLGMREAMA